MVWVLLHLSSLWWWFFFPKEVVFLRHDNPAALGARVSGFGRSSGMSQQPITPTDVASVRTTKQNDLRLVCIGLLSPLQCWMPAGLRWVSIVCMRCLLIMRLFSYTRMMLFSHLQDHEQPAQRRAGRPGVPDGRVQWPYRAPDRGRTPSSSTSTYVLFCSMWHLYGRSMMSHRFWRPV